MVNSDNLSLFVAFVAGLLSILSPCVLPLLPSYVSYVTGISFDELVGGSKTSIFKRTLQHSLLFIFGFSFVFISLGASASFFGKILVEYQDLVARVGGGLIIIFALHLLGILKLSFLEKDKKLHLQTKPMGYIGSVFVGMVFAAAWTPCVGPILGSILTLAATKSDVGSGIMLLTAYSLGFAIPFLIFSIFLNSFLFYFEKFRKYLRFVSVASGVLLLILGITLMSGYFSKLAAYLAKFSLINF